MTDRGNGVDDRGGLFSSFGTEGPDDSERRELLSPGSTLIGSSFGNAAQQPRQRSGYTALTPSLTPDRSHEGDLGATSSHGLGISERRGRRVSFDSAEEEEADYFQGEAMRSSPYSFSSTAPLRTGTHSYHKAKSSDLNEPRKSVTSVRSRKSYNDFSPQVTCASREEIWKNAGNHVYVTLMILGIFSTIFSGIYLGIAIARPRYGKFISDYGNLTYSNATLLFALFAKLIELSFVTCFIGFVGQVISQRAFNKSKGYGVTLAEISMRGWIMQPGQMLVHPHAVKYAVASLMGALAITAALTAMLYTTAASALVSPQLMMSKFIDRTMEGAIKQGFGDVSAIQYSCGTPANDAKDIPTKYQTCIGPQLSAQSNNDWSTWLANWTVFANTTAGSSDLANRPPPYSLVSDNTTVQGAWIEVSDMPTVSNAYDRIVNNVTLAMPHGGLIDAARNPNNSILQPKQNDGFGSYNIHASMLSGAINVLCAEMSEDELAPLIYDHWPNANKSLDLANWANDYAWKAEYVPSYGENQWLNSTIVDQIFGFGPTFGQRRPPVFPKLPLVYNTLLNNTGAYAPLPYRDALYVLGGNPDAQGNLSSFSLCQMRGYRTTSCSSWYNATSSQSRMEAHCEDPKDDLQFEKNGGQGLPSGTQSTSLLWVDLADVWASAVTLGNGVTDGAAANSRLLTQFFPTGRALDPKMPSMAEALAVMAGNTMILGTRNGPINTTTDDDDKTAGHTSVAFKSELQSQQYASGPVSGYQNAFYIILVAIFGGNVLVLTWLILNRGLVTDFCDPANLFSITINSPPSHMFAGSCGCGPEGKQYLAKWYVNLDGEHVYLENNEQEQELAENRARERIRSDLNTERSPIMAAYTKLSKRKSVF